MSTYQRCNRHGFLFKYRKLSSSKRLFQTFPLLLKGTFSRSMRNKFTRNQLFCEESWAWCLHQIKSVLFMYRVSGIPSVHLGILKWHDLRRSLAATSTDMLLAYWCFVMWRATIRNYNFYHALPVETTGQLVYVWLKNKERAKDLVWYTKVGYLMMSCYARVVSFFFVGQVRECIKSICDINMKGLWTEKCMRLKYVLK